MHKLSPPVVVTFPPVELFLRVALTRTPSVERTRPAVSVIRPPVVVAAWRIVVRAARWCRARSRWLRPRFAPLAVAGARPPPLEVMV